MVTMAHRTEWIRGLALLGILGWMATTQAQSFASWHIGSVAKENIITPVALTVVDARATAQRQAAVARTVPAIFLAHSSVTNIMVMKFKAYFAGTHSNFLAGLQQNFNHSLLSEKTIQSSDFDYFLTAFNIQNKPLLITSQLASQWARGQSGLGIRDNLIKLLLQTMSRLVRPDHSAKGFLLGKNALVVPVHSARDIQSVKAAKKHGKVIPLRTISTLTRLRGLFRRHFPLSEQPFARQLATYLHPNCLPDPKLTTQARADATASIAVVHHYAAGQTIVRRGEVIDTRILAALTQLKLQVMPAGPSHALATASNQSHVRAASSQKPNREDHNVRLTALVLGLGGLFMAGLWGMISIRRRKNAVQPVAMPSSAPLPPTVEIEPQMAQALKSAVARELAEQRQELLQVQKNATNEVLRLMQRFNELHIPWQERQVEYEKRIQELEQELSVRTEENRELLKLKIDLLRQQLEKERVAPRVSYN